MKICSRCQTVSKDLNARFCGRDGQPLIDAPDPVQTATANGGSPLSGSLAMTLFAHHFVNHKIPDDGLTPPCQPELRVNSIQFDYELPIIALWYLREHNFIRFVEPIPPRDYPTAGIIANLTHPASMPGLEFDLWEIIKICAPGTPAHAVFRQFLGKAIPYPEENLRRRICEWLVQLGYGQADTTPKPFFQFGDSGERRLLEFLPDCQRITAEQEAAQKIHQEWIKFLTAEPDLYQTLFEDVVRAGDDACSSGKHRWSSYCKAKDDYDARARR